MKTLFLKCCSRLLTVTLILFILSGCEKEVFEAPAEMADGFGPTPAYVFRITE